MLQLLRGVEEEEMDTGSEPESDEEDEIPAKSRKQTMKYERFDKDDPLLAESADEEDEESDEESDEDDMEMESE